MKCSMVSLRVERMMDMSLRCKVYYKPYLEIIGSDWLRVVTFVDAPTNFYGLLAVQPKLYIWSHGEVLIFHWKWVR